MCLPWQQAIVDAIVCPAEQLGGSGLPGYHPHQLELLVGRPQDLASPLHRRKLSHARVTAHVIWGRHVPGLLSGSVNVLLGGHAEASHLQSHRLPASCGWRGDVPKVAASAPAHDTQSSSVRLGRFGQGALLLLARMVPLSRANSNSSCE